ncbi:MAG: hypothetical protein IT534_04935 [Bauldia sp.]|nr:hypothetical protein [Bauldia sp.]
MSLVRHSRSAIAAGVIAALLPRVAAEAAPPADAAAVEFRAEASAVCTAILNARDADAFLAGRRASTELLAAAMTDTPPTPAEVAAIVPALDFMIATIGGAYETLAALTPPPGPDADAWAVLLADGEAAIRPYRTRRDVLASGVWDRDAIRGALHAETPGLVAAMEQLGFERRDCGVVFGAPGVAPDHAAFEAGAANACRTIVERRLAGDYAAQADMVLMAIFRQLRSEPVAADGLAEALAALGAEWQATLADFSAVPTADVTDAAAWEEMLAAVSDRMAGYGARAAALAGNDPAALAAVFAPTGAFAHAGGADLLDLGLADRDCRAVTF